MIFFLYFNLFSEELIDKRILASERIENISLKTIDFIDMRDNSLVLRICPEERSRFFLLSKLSLSQFLTIWTEYKLIINTRLVVQMGTSDGDRAAAAALRLVDDVAGI